MTSTDFDWPSHSPERCSSPSCSFHSAIEPDGSFGTLTEHAQRALAAAGLTVEQWARANYMRSGRWSGDRCGCMDDRCIGHHHSHERDCQCLSAMLQDWLSGDVYRTFAVKPPGPVARERRVRDYARQRGIVKRFPDQGYTIPVTPTDEQLTPAQRRRARHKFNRNWM